MPELPGADGHRTPAQEREQARRLAERYRLEFVDMDAFHLDNELFRSIPADVMLRYGFLEETDVPATLKQVAMCGQPFEMMKTSFFLSRQTLIASAKPGMALWREKLFAWMLRNAASAMEFFRLPTNRVVELGSQIEI